MLTFKKKERLCSKVVIDKLFESKTSFYITHFKFIWQTISISDSPVKIIMVVPKRNFKKAVDRNKLKRRMRECYRKNKASLYLQLGEKKIVVGLLFTSKRMLNYDEMETAIKTGLAQLSKVVMNEKVA